MFWSLKTIQSPIPVILLFLLQPGAQQVGEELLRYQKRAASSNQIEQTFSPLSLCEKVPRESGPFSTAVADEIQKP